LTPFAALAFGLILIYFVIKVWIQRKPALAGAPSTPAIPDTYREQIEKELKDLG
jgi:hypothetical protein